MYNDVTVNPIVDSILKDTSRRWKRTELNVIANDGTRVRFTCLYWEKEVAVVMISPYNGMYRICHMPYLVPTSYIANALWEKQALSLVSDIMRKEKWKQEHVDEINERRMEAGRRHKIIDKYENLLTKMKIRNKANFRRQELSAKLYQKRCGDYHWAISELERLRREESESWWITQSMNNFTSKRLGSLEMSECNEGWVYMKKSRPLLGEATDWIRCYKLRTPHVSSECVVRVGGYIDVIKLVSSIRRAEGPRIFVLIALIKIAGKDSAWKLMA